MHDTAASLFKRAFPKAYLGMTYRDLLAKHVTDLALWAQVLADERADATGEARRRVRVPWLIEQYRRMELAIREIETPPDSLTTHRDEPLQRPVHQGKVDFDEVRRIMQEEYLKGLEAIA